MIDQTAPQFFPELRLLTVQPIQSIGEVCEYLLHVIFFLDECLQFQKAPVLLFIKDTELLFFLCLIRLIQSHTRILPDEVRKILSDNPQCPLSHIDGQKIIRYNGKERGSNYGKQTEKGTPPPRYDDAFKAGAVRMVTEQGRPSAEVAKELGICIDTLRSWLKTAGVQLGQTDRQNRDNRKMRDLEAEVRALRKQLAEKDEVIDILKKSVGILSKP